MTNTLEFDISRDDRAIIYQKGANDLEFTCLIDTGAGIPVWFADEDMLIIRFPDAEKTDNITILNGLGDKPLFNIPVWRIPEFDLKGDNGCTLKFMDLMVAVYETSRFSFDMIIPLTMLNRSDFSFTYSMSATHGKFTISSSKDRYYTKSIFDKYGKGYLNKIQVMLEGE